MDKGNTTAGIQELKSNKRLTRGGSTKGRIVFSFYTSLLAFHAPVQQLFISVLLTKRGGTTQTLCLHFCFKFR